MPTVEDIIVQRYQMTLEDFIARGPQIVPAYYSRILNAINAEDSEELQKILIEMDGGVVGISPALFDYEFTSDVWFITSDITYRSPSALPDVLTQHCLNFFFGLSRDLKRSACSTSSKQHAISAQSRANAEAAFYLKVN